MGGNLNISQLSLLEMGLRDYIATHVSMPKVEFGGIEPMCNFMEEPEPQTQVEFISLGLRAEARLRYMLADAMLVERLK